MARKLSFTKEVVDGLLTYAKEHHPTEAILLLRGKATKDSLRINALVIPPMAEGGYSYAYFPLYMLPLDLSVLGTGHSHPSGVLRPSAEDLDNFYGYIMVIVCPPYSSIGDMAAFDRGGRVYPFSLER